MIVIRPATEGDLQILGEVENDAGQAFVELGIHCFDPMESDFYAHGLPGAQILVAAQDNDLVAFAAFREVDGQAYLHELSVRHSRQRQGIGRSLLEAAMKAAQDSGYKTMTLITSYDLPFNRPFYENAGFTIFEPTEEGEPQLCEIMRSDLETWQNRQKRVAMISQLL